MTGRAGDTFTALAAPCSRSSCGRGRRATGAASRARASPGRSSRTRPCASALGLRPGESGVRLTRVLPHGSAGGVLEPGRRAARAGRREARRHRALRAPALRADALRAALHRRAPPGRHDPCGSCATASDCDVQLTLRRMPPEQERVPPYVFGRGPDYVVVGGLVFQELTRPLPRRPGATGRAARRRASLIAVDRERGRAGRRRSRASCSLSSVLPDAANLGYQDLRDLIVASVNGRRSARSTTCGRPSPRRRAATTWSSSCPARAPPASCSTRRRPRRPPARLHAPTASRGWTRSAP